VAELFRFVEEVAKELLVAIHRLLEFYTGRFATDVSVAF
jgi:hypothetical protein